MKYSDVDSHVDLAVPSEESTTPPTTRAPREGGGSGAQKRKALQSFGWVSREWRA